jgi:hypothetical protein
MSRDKDEEFSVKIPVVKGIGDKDKKKYRLLKALRSGINYAKQVRSAKMAEMEENPTEGNREFVGRICMDISQIEGAYRENGGIL